jgi:hypothetical protein
MMTSQDCDLTSTGLPDTGLVRGGGVSKPRTMKTAETASAVLQEASSAPSLLERAAWVRRGGSGQRWWRRIAAIAKPTASRPVATRAGLDPTPLSAWPALPVLAPTRPRRSLSMSFQAYLDTIQTKTGLDAEGLKAAPTPPACRWAARSSPEVKAGQVVAWGKGELGLGHGHAMAIYALLSGKRGPGD